MKFQKGARLKEDLYSNTGILLLRKGTFLTAKLASILNKYEVVPDPSLKGRRIAAEVTGIFHDVLYENIYRSMEELQQTIRVKAELCDAEIQDMEKNFHRLYKEVLATHTSFLELMEHFSSDEYLFKHCIHVGLIAASIGKMLKLPHEKQNLLAQMGLFHDIGKFTIDPRILNKPGKLTNEEFAVIKTHPAAGYRLLENTSLDPMILKGALMHHERLDGSGYPEGRKNIPFLVRILSVADTFDAICSNRAYRRRQPVFYAIDELMADAKAGRLDSEVVLPFANFLMENYRNQPITMRNGARGKIVHIHPLYPNQPILKIEGYPLLNLKEQKLTLFQIANMQ
ncbi:HD-GYP domain-containing protein [Weizmannia acidilactici]|uniref:HD-GYP domain-containing protein n=1 Tax=Weizmannia acidilactici TaxID=2607726 RepID=UPI00124F2A77|nr:HD-GYP domain-containing protein [Weizmannia acidilactici]GER66712.1 HD family phosphohydrolase [Weizmannia acidilactici]GER72866.1 HD family phosphohydrolase [Weizmannia acidilactici]